MCGMSQSGQHATQALIELGQFANVVCVVHLSQSGQHATQALIELGQFANV